MSKRSNKPMVSGAGSEVIVSGLGEILATQSKEALEALRAQLRTAKQAKKDEAFYTKYPHVVRGSLQLVPAGEVIEGLVSKGRVCRVTLDDGSTRLVNTQDAFQVKSAPKPKGVARAQAQIARLQAQLAEMASEEVAS
jgi:hypothetical protein